MKLAFQLILFVLQTVVSLVELGQGRPFLRFLSGLTLGPGEGANVRHQAARLLLADLSLMRRHVSSFTVEDARLQLLVGTSVLPGSFREVGDSWNASYRPASRATLRVALCTFLSK
jgi:hypothetical protein